MNQTSWALRRLVSPTKEDNRCFWRVPDVWCEDRELSFAAFFLFLTWVSTPKKLASELHFGQHISVWMGLILPCVVDLFLYSPLLWTDNAVHGNVFHTFLQSLVAVSGV